MDGNNDLLAGIQGISLPITTVRALLADYSDLLHNINKEGHDAFMSGMAEEKGFSERAERVVASTIVGAMLALTLREEAEDTYKKAVSEMEPAKDDPRLLHLRQEIAIRAMKMNKNLTEWTDLEKELTVNRMKMLKEH